MILSSVDLELGKDWKKKEFQNNCMSGNYKDPKKYSAVSGSNNNLSISPKDSRIIDVLLSVLERIYERMMVWCWKNLVQLTAPKPDRSCINSRTKTCEHGTAIAENSNNLLSRLGALNVVYL